MLSLQHQFFPILRNTGASSMSRADWGRSIPLFSSVPGSELNAHGKVLAALGNAAAVTSENRGLFQMLQSISAPAPWSTSYTSHSTSILGVLSLISFSHFLCLFSIFCFFFGLFSLRCHKLCGWAQLCDAAYPPWSWLCLAHSMSWSLMEASPAANNLSWTPSTGGR